MPVLTFQPQFWDKVKSGEKRQTIRSVRKRPIKVGDNLSLRKWLGRPRHSKQEVLREDVCIETAAVQIFEGGLVIAGTLILANSKQNSFAQLDGFDSYDSMLAWFRENHGLPFSGTCIKW